MKSILVLLLFTAIATAQQPEIDPELKAFIDKTPAIDNHTHVPKLVGANEKDDEYDALPCSNYVPPSDDPWTARIDNPDFQRSWKALWGYKYDDHAPAHLAELQKTKDAIKQREGDHYNEWVLDQLGIQTMFANRIALGRGLNAPRFRWVPFADALMYPLETTALQNTPDRKFFYSREAMLLQRYAKESGAATVPNSLDEYLKAIVTPTLERWKKQGAVAIKFEMAYLRSLEVKGISREEAAKLYAADVSMNSNAPAELSIKLSNFLFRYIAREAGRLGLAVHIHTGFGCGSYFFLSGSNPTLLEPVLNDATLRKTNFVLIHGGWPYTDQMAVELGKPNVYTDLSEQPWLVSPQLMARNVRTWLELYPEKVLFGTDLYGGDPGVDWEEVGWVTERHVRDALGIALTSMMRDGLISRDRAHELARMVLNGNATKLYGDLSH